MKIALISTYMNADPLGPRYISSYLKRGGHNVRLIFLTGRGRKPSAGQYRRELLDELLGLVRQVDLVGVSLMTNTYFRAAELSREIRQAGLKMPIVWGGVHPTVSPRTCIDHADFVCVGEGELSMLELCNRLDAGRDPSGVPGMGVVRNGRLEEQGVWPLPEDLDGYPFPDHGQDGDQYLVRKDRLVQLSTELMQSMLKRYRVLSTRGCPYKCAFCNNAAIQKLYRDNGSWVRKRSAENVIDELVEAMARLPKMRSVKIVDDLFFVRSEEEMQHFAQVYQERVALPFEVDAHPATISRGKVEPLVQAGMFRVHMGIQSGSEKTNLDIYHRPTSKKQVAAAIDMLADYPEVQAEYHYIVANPFEPEEQLIETLYFAAEHHRGNFKWDVFPLALFPGTPLYDRAVAEGIISEASQKELYGQVWRQSRTWAALGNYLVVVLVMTLRLKRWGLPAGMVKRIVSVAKSRPVRAVVDRAYLPVLLIVGYVIMRLVRNLIYQPFIRPFTKRRRPQRRGRAAAAGSRK